MLEHAPFDGSTLAGDTVTITYFPARNGKPLGFIRSIVLADKREIQISSGSSED